MNGKTTILTNASNPEIVTTSANTPNVATRVFVAKVPEGARYTLDNLTVVNNQPFNGALIVTDLRNSDGERIREGRLIFGYEGSNAEFTVPMRGVPLSNWADLDIAQQKSAQYRGALAASTDLNVGPDLTLTNRSKLVIQMESPEVVDWSKSFIEIAVTEVNG